MAEANRLERFHATKKPGGAEVLFETDETLTVISVPREHLICMKAALEVVLISAEVKDQIVCGNLKHNVLQLNEP